MLNVGLMNLLYDTEMTGAALVKMFKILPD